MPVISGPHSGAGLTRVLGRAAIRAACQQSNTDQQMALRTR